MSKSKSGGGEGDEPTSAPRGGMKAPGPPTHRVKGDTIETRHPFLRQLGSRISQMRRESNMSQQQLAGGADLGLVAVHQIETARSNPTILTILKIAKALDCKITDLFVDQPADADAIIE